MTLREVTTETRKDALFYKERAERFEREIADLERRLAAAREALAPLWKGLMILHERLTTDWANRLDDPYELSGRLTGHDVIKLLAVLTKANEGKQ